MTELDSLHPASLLGQNTGCVWLKVLDTPESDVAGKFLLGLLTSEIIGRGLDRGV